MARPVERASMPNDPDQEEVLKKKDHVTQSSRGLQQWGDEAQDPEQSTGTAQTGTAQRQARIARGQMGPDADTAAPELRGPAHNAGRRANGQLGDDEDEPHP